MLVSEVDGYSLDEQGLLKKMTVWVSKNYQK